MYKLDLALNNYQLYSLENVEYPFITITPQSTLT